MNIFVSQETIESRVTRIPLNSISNVSHAGILGRAGTTSSMWNFSQSQDPARSKVPRTAVHKPSLDEVRDNSVVALTNKYGKGKYWFKSACPTPDPRWAADQQLMIGPIPGDVEYSQLRSAFLAQGHTLHLFIQNNQVGHKQGMSTKFMSTQSLFFAIKSFCYLSCLQFLFLIPL